MNVSKQKEDFYLHTFKVNTKDSKTKDAIAPAQQLAQNLASSVFDEMLEAGTLADFYDGKGTASFLNGLNSRSGDFNYKIKIGDSKRRVNYSIKTTALRSYAEKKLPELVEQEKIQVPVESYHDKDKKQVTLTSFIKNPEVGTQDYEISAVAKRVVGKFLNEGRFGELMNEKCKADILIDAMNEESGKYVFKSPDKQQKSNLMQTFKGVLVTGYAVETLPVLHERIKERNSRSKQMPNIGININIDNDDDNENNNDSTDGTDGNDEASQLAISAQPPGPSAVDVLGENSITDLQIAFAASSLSANDHTSGSIPNTGPSVHGSGTHMDTFNVVPHPVDLDNEVVFCFPRSSDHDHGDEASKERNYTGLRIARPIGEKGLGLVSFGTIRCKSDYQLDGLNLWSVDYDGDGKDDLDESTVVQYLTFYEEKRGLDDVAP